MLSRLVMLILLWCLLGWIPFPDAFVFPCSKHDVKFPQHVSMMGRDPMDKFKSFINDATNALPQGSIAPAAVLAAGIFGGPLGLMLGQ